MSRIQNLQDEIQPERAERSPLYATSSKDSLNAQADPKKQEENDARGKEEVRCHEELGTDSRKRATAASVIQKRWREHRERVGSYSLLHLED